MAPLQCFPRLCQPCPSLAQGGSIQSLARASDHLTIITGKQGSEKWASASLTYLRAPENPALDVLVGVLQVRVGLSATLQTFQVGDTHRSEPSPT